jgi:hypothetical protein
MSFTAMRMARYVIPQHKYTARKASTIFQLRVTGTQRPSFDQRNDLLGYCWEK